MRNFSISKLADTILAQRKKLNMTQQELADKAGINRSMLCRLENQDYVPSLDQLTRLANTLQFDVTEVFIEYSKPVFEQIIPRSITVFGAGYVGLSIATLLARYHHVTIVDILPETVEKISHRICPFQDEYIEKFFARADLGLTATTDAKSACENAKFVIIAVPTGFDPQKRVFDTSQVESVIETVLHVNPDAAIIIRSDVPVGFTASMCRKHNTENILFSPEFLRESKALYDNLYPGRIIVGCNNSAKHHAGAFADILRSAAIKKDVELRLTGLSEAESIAIFSNLFLAMRVSCFNDLDTFADSNGLNTKEIIDGICLDPRIGSYGHTPSFGHSGFGLPVHASQLPTGLDPITYRILASIVQSNQIRKEYIADRVLEKAGLSQAYDCWDEPNEKRATIGVYRLTMENDSVNFRHSAMPNLIRQIKAGGAAVIIYEPLIEDGATFLGCKVINDLKKFKKQSDIIMANRYDACLDNVNSKVYTRDLSSVDHEYK